MRRIVACRIAVFVPRSCFLFALVSLALLLFSLLLFCIFLFLLLSHYPARVLLPVRIIGLVPLLVRVPAPALVSAPLIVLAVAARNVLACLQLAVGFFFLVLMVLSHGC